MTISLARSLRAVPAAVLTVLVLSACSFSGSVSAATSCSARPPGRPARRAEQRAGWRRRRRPRARRPAARQVRSPAHLASGDVVLVRREHADTPHRPLPHRRALRFPAAGSAGPVSATPRWCCGTPAADVHACTGSAAWPGRLRGSALPTHQVRTGGPAATVLLAPGATVRSALHWSAVNGPGDRRPDRASRRRHPAGHPAGRDGRPVGGLDPRAGLLRAGRSTQRALRRPDRACRIGNRPMTAMVVRGVTPPAHTGS